MKDVLEERTYKLTKTEIIDCVSRSLAKDIDNAHIVAELMNNIIAELNSMLYSHEESQDSARVEDTNTCKTSNSRFIILRTYPHNQEVAIDASKISAIYPSNSPVAPYTYIHYVGDNSDGILKVNESMEEILRTLEEMCYEKDSSV